jgi:hypothetical protein
MEMKCPVCQHHHLILFGKYNFDCKNCNDNAAVAKKLYKLRDAGNSAGTQEPDESTKAAPEVPSGELHLAEYGLAKNLNAQLLTQWFKAREGPHPYYTQVKCGVCFPYFNERGEEVTQQWRYGMGKKNRRFLPNKPTYLYGGLFLQRLEQMAANGEGRDDIFLVEGESNPQTLSQLGYPALGLPGVGNWQPKWAGLKCFEAAKRIYFFLDMKDGAPETVAIVGAQKVADSFPDGKVLAVKLPVKDVSELWLQHTDPTFGDGVEAFQRDLHDAICAAKPINPIHEEIEGKPADLGEEVLAACPILKTFVDLTLPYVETDINNIICDFLAAAGAAIGLKVYARHLYDTHPAATYQLLIANTTVGKGTVWGCVNELFRMAVAEWKKCLRTSARSQQALYRALKEAADPKLITENEEGEEESKPNPDYTGGSILLRFSEVSAVFKSMRAEWSTMSQALRETYDGRPVSNELGQKDKSTKVDNPYALSLLGDVSPWELSEVISDVDFASGVANRFVWCVSHQTKTIPRAGPAPDYRELAERLRRVIPPEQIGEITYSKDGEAAWDAWVLSLPANDDGRLGSACGRMRANALRLAVLFAVLDERRLVLSEALCIKAEHVNAAAAILNRHRATVQWFLERPAAMPAGLPESKKDKLWRQIEKLRAALKNGRITNNELHTLFSNQTAQERKEIAKAASLNYTDEVDEKGNTVGVWE